MYTWTYIYTSIYQIKQSVLLGYVFIVFFLKNTTLMQRSRAPDFDLELLFLRNPYMQLHVLYLYTKFYKH